MDNIYEYLASSKLLLSKNFFNAAFCLVCCAIDACAYNEYVHEKITSNKLRWTKWIGENINTITKFGLPATFGKNCKFKMGKIEDLKVDKEGFCTLEDFLYYAFRCSFVHEAKAINAVKFTSSNLFAYNKNEIVIPFNIIIGLIKSVEEYLDKNGYQ